MSKRHESNYDGQHVAQKWLPRQSTAKNYSLWLTSPTSLSQMEGLSLIQGNGVVKLFRCKRRQSDQMARLFIQSLDI